MTVVVKHNFDETKFKWLWAKYVKAGNIEKHCTASLIGPYSKKFSGSSNHNLLSQPIIEMDEVSDGEYEAIYFFGVLNQGYLNKNPLRNNYRHNVHFAIRPFEGARDVWDFENWHVEIENGVLERIPETYELGSKFFSKPYSSHFYTCRIFRWMVGHFYPQELVDVTANLPASIISEYGGTRILTKDLVFDLIDAGKKYVEDFFESEDGWGYWNSEAEKLASIRNNVVDRFSVSEYISENMGGGCGPLVLEIYSCFSHKNGISEEDMIKFINLGIEEGLNMLFPYQEMIPNMTLYKR